MTILVNTSKHFHTSGHFFFIMFMTQSNQIKQWIFITASAICWMLSSYRSTSDGNTPIFLKFALIAGHSKIWQGVSWVSEQLLQFLYTLPPSLFIFMPLKWPVLNLIIVFVINRSFAIKRIKKCPFFQTTEPLIEKIYQWSIQLKFATIQLPFT